MGNKNSFCSVYPNAPSPTYYELQSVVSDPVDKHIDFESLFCGIAYLIKIGGVPAGEQNPKEQALVVDEPNLFCIRKTFDGKRMGLDEDIVTHHIYKTIPRRGIIYEELRTEPGLSLREISATIIHLPSLRVECWRQTISLERCTGEAPTVHLHGLISAALGDQAIECKADQESIVAPGALSVLSEDLSKKTTFDELWDSLLQVMKTQESNPLKKFAEVKEAKKDDKGNESFEVACLLDAKGLMQMGLPVPQLMDRNMTYKVTAVKDNCAFVVELIDEGLMAVYEVKYFVVHKEPLVVEHWHHKYGERRSGIHIRAVVDWCLNTVIKAFKEHKQTGRAFDQAIAAEVRISKGDAAYTGAGPEQAPAPAAPSEEASPAEDAAKGS